MSLKVFSLFFLAQVEVHAVPGSSAGGMDQQNKQKVKVTRIVQDAINHAHAVLPRNKKKTQGTERSEHLSL